LASRTVKYSFQCAGCQQAKYDFWVEIDFHRQAIRKLGQNPPYTIEVEKNIEDFLGEEDSELFKRGRVCESQGYGLGAYVYYRRVLEDCISGLIEKLTEVFILQSIDKSILDPTFRTLFRNSEAILPASLQEEETELATDAVIAHNPLFL